MNNEIKRILTRTNRVKPYAAAAMAFAAVCSSIFIQAADAQNKADKQLIAVNDLMWGTDLTTSLSQAKSKQKYVLADVYTDWCGWCKRLDRDTFSNPQVMAYLNKKFVCVKVNAERPNGRPVAVKYKVGGYPCVLVFDPNGTLIGKLSGYFRAAEFQQTLEDVLKNPPSDPLNQ